MKQFLISPENPEFPFIDLTERDFHYLVHVRRYKKGSVFPARDKEGNTYTCRIEEISKNCCRISISKALEKNKEDFSIILYQCLPKGQKLDQIIRQATEMGIRLIVPVISRYSVPNPSKEKTGRWERIIKEAIQQSGSKTGTEISGSTFLKDLPEIPAETGRLGLFFHSEPIDNRTLHDYLSEYIKEISVVVGPEGGLAVEEVELLLKKGYKPMFLRTNTLRTETAALYSLAAIQLLVSEKKTWELRGSIK